MRRPGPRPLAVALDSLMAGAEPQTPLAALQRVWAQAVGERIAAEAEPVSERAGVVTVACGSAVWAQELELMSEDLLRRLGDALGDGARPVRLRFVAGRRPPSP